MEFPKQLRSLRTGRIYNLKESSIREDNALYFSEAEPEKNLMRICVSYKDTQETLKFEVYVEPEPVTKTSDQWYQELYANKLKIYDPDGWDRSNWEFSFFEEQITKGEFENRLFRSTVEPLGI